MLHRWRTITFVIVLAVIAGACGGPKPPKTGQIHLFAMPAEFDLKAGHTITATLTMGDMVETIRTKLGQGATAELFLRDMPVGPWQVAVTSDGWPEGKVFLQEVPVEAGRRSVVWLMAYHVYETKTAVAVDVVEPVDDDMIWPLGVGTSWTVSVFQQEVQANGPVTGERAWRQSVRVIDGKFENGRWRFEREQRLDDGDWEPMRPVLYWPAEGERGQRYSASEFRVDFGELTGFFGPSVCSASWGELHGEGRWEVECDAFTLPGDGPGVEEVYVGTRHTFVPGLGQTRSSMHLIERGLWTWPDQDPVRRR